MTAEPTPLSILADAYVDAGGRPSIANAVAFETIERLEGRGYALEPIEGGRLRVRPMTEPERAEAARVREILEG